MGVVDRKEDGLFDVDREYQMGCPCRRKRWMEQEMTLRASGGGGGFLSWVEKEKRGRQQYAGQNCT